MTIDYRLSSRIPSVSTTGASKAIPRDAKCVTEISGRGGRGRQKIRKLGGDKIYKINALNRLNSQTLFIDDYDK